MPNGDFEHRMWEDYEPPRSGKPQDPAAKWKAQAERLRAAIGRHRDDVWGRDPVGNPHDAELYKVLADE